MKQVHTKSCVLRTNDAGVQTVAVSSVHGSRGNINRLLNHSCVGGVGVDRGGSGVAAGAGSASHRRRRASAHTAAALGSHHLTASGEILGSSESRGDGNHIGEEVGSRQDRGGEPALIVVVGWAAHAQSRSGCLDTTTSDGRSRHEA